MDNKNNNYAIKVKRKNIDEILKNNLDYFVFIFNFLSKMPYLRKLNLNMHFNENKKILIEQLDFKKEVEHLQFFQDKYEEVDYIVIPNVYPDYTQINNTMIVMDFIEGRTLSQLNDVENKHEYCKLLAKFGIKSIFYDGVYHADLHQGNLLFLNRDNNLQIGLLDFGVIDRLTREEQNLFYQFMKFIAQNEFREATNYLLNNITEILDNTKPNLEFTEEDKKAAIDEISDIFEKVMLINKKATARDLYNINSMLAEYNLMICKFFCKAQISFMINETLCNNLAKDQSFITLFGEYISEI